MLCGALLAPVGAQAWTFTDVTAAAGLVYQHGYTALATRQGILSPGARYELATGDKAAILAYLCAGRRGGRPDGT